MILVLDAAGHACLAAIVSHGSVLAEQRSEADRGSSALLPGMVQAVLRAAALQPSRLSAIAATTGPGSFTGIRAALALAHGLALAARLPLAGVSVPAALRASAPETDRPIWVALDSRRGRIFLDCGDDQVQSLALPDLPRPDTPVLIAGNAAPEAVQALGSPATLLPILHPTPQGIARAAARHPRPAAPFYVDAVAARPVPARPTPA